MVIGGWKSYKLGLWDPPFPPSLIFEKFEKSTAVPDMTPEPIRVSMQAIQ